MTESKQKPGIDLFSIAGLLMAIAGVALFVVMLQSSKAGLLGLSHRFYLIVSHALLIFQLAFAALFFGIGKILRTMGKDPGTATRDRQKIPPPGAVELLLDLVSAALIAGSVIVLFYLLPESLSKLDVTAKWLLMIGVGNLLFSLIFALAGAGIKKMLMVGGPAAAAASS